MLTSRLETTDLASALETHNGGFAREQWEVQEKFGKMPFCFE